MGKGRKPRTPPAGDPRDVLLTDVEGRFVDEYVIDCDRVRAWIAASGETCHRRALVASRRVRRLPHVDAEIRARMHAARVRCQVKADNVLRELARIAFADIIDLYGLDGRLRPMRAVPLASRRAVKSIRVRRERVVTRTTTMSRGRTNVTTDVTTHEMELEVILHDKLDALEKLCKHLGLNDGIPPLEVLLSVLPPDVAQFVRERIGDADSDKINSR